ncbi:hypothetical protein FHS16_006394 [Paenibacillus endophyticus]|uniref:Uncharacterized protein n=1 Tax=Paenibacillus endophyticus TaxID=1294268 RepID=A0A7W5CEL3_9BACL|nr:hypothetical protein [Paenibacillus endophyticus]MBB3156272.1 hypothetical protein [Paenibacillus endophyticus]
MNTLATVNYKGKAAVTKGSSFKFNAANIRRMITNITGMNDSSDKTDALLHLNSLLVKRDFTDAGLTGDWDNSAGADSLLKDVASDTPSHPQLILFNK